MNFFRRLFRKKRVKIEPVKIMPEIKSGDTPNKMILLKAISQIGVGEIAGKKSNKQIETYHKFSTKNNDRGSNESVSWCSSFLCWVVETCGFHSTNSKMARSYEKWGEKVTTPIPGDIVTFWRKSLKSGYGHVAVFLLKKGKYIYVLGGNQSDEVNVTRYKTDKITGFHREDSKTSYTQTETQELIKIANELVFGEDVKSGGSVT